MPVNDTASENTCCSSYIRRANLALPVPWAELPDDSASRTVELCRSDGALACALLVPIKDLDSG